MAPKKGRGQTISLGAFVGAAGAASNCDWAEDTWADDIQFSKQQTSAEEKEKYVRSLHESRYKHDSTLLGKEPGFRDTSVVDDTRLPLDMPPPYFAHCIGLNPAMTEPELIDFLGGMGVLRVIFDHPKRDLPRSDGKKDTKFALVEFDSVMNLQFALFNNGKLTKGARVFVNKADEDRVTKILASHERAQARKGGVGKVPSREDMDQPNLGDFRSNSNAGGNLGDFRSNSNAGANLGDFRSNSNAGANLGDFRSNNAAVQPVKESPLANWRNSAPEVAKPATDSDNWRSDAKGAAAKDTKTSPLAQEGERRFARNDRPRSDRPRNDRQPPAAQNLDRWGSLGRNE